MLNRISINGYVGKDGVLLRYTQSGKAVAGFKLGNKRSFKNQEGKYDWDNFPVVLWSGTAEFAANNAAEGDLVGVSGRLQTRSFDGQDGKRVWMTEIVADEFEILRKKQTTAESMGTEIQFDEDNPPF